MRRLSWHGLAVVGCSLGLLAAVPGCGGSSSDDDGSGGGGGGTSSTKDAGTKDSGTHTVTLTDGAVVTVENDGGEVVVVEPDGAVVAVDAGCMSNADCAVGVCMPDGTCDPTATDGMEDSTETDTDCGGALNADGTMNTSSDNAPACKTSQKCLIGYDCGNKVCASAPEVGGNGDGTPVDCPSGATCTCQPPTATDGVQNDSETDEDCGGKLVANGVANPSSDQAGGDASLCAAAAAETGQHCNFGSDCNQGVCNNNAGVGGLPDDCPAATICTCQLGSPNDHVKNGGESDVDCGGNSSDGATPCPQTNPITGTTSKCANSADCESLDCNTTTGLCVPPTDTDGIQNGGETDIDCGGAVDSKGAAIPTSDGAPPCLDLTPVSAIAPVQTCTKNSACPSGFCSPTKGVCYVTRVSSCAINADCKSGYCSSAEKLCVDGMSCTVPQSTKASAIMDVVTEATLSPRADATGTPNMNGIGEIAGITTCGRGEATDFHSPDGTGLVQHESCCKSLDISVKEVGATAAADVRVDKYEVTSGRMRQFIESIGAADNGAYDVRAWVKAQFTKNGTTYTASTPIGALLAAQIPTGQASTPDVIDLYPDAVSGDPIALLQQLGGTTMDTGVPSDLQGCYTTTGASGAGTYWFDEADQNTVAESSPRAFTKDYYDIKSMNCTPYWMAAAFCAWDGGHLTTKEEYDVLWGPGTYPWSVTVDPNNTAGTSRLWNNIKASIPAGTLVTDWTINNLNEQEYFYFYPNEDNPPALMAGEGIIDTLDKQTDKNGNVLINSYADFTPYIAAPGRFERDNTLVTSTGTSIYPSESWLDVAANMFEYHELPLASFTGGSFDFCDTTGNVACIGTYSTSVPNAAGCTGACCAYGGAVHPPTYAPGAANPSGCPESAGQTACIRQNSANKPVCGIERAPKMPTINWQGGSWEVHAIPTGGADNNYGEPMQTQYGKAGFRCARAAE